MLQIKPHRLPPIPLLHNPGQQHHRPGRILIREQHAPGMLQRAKIHHHAPSRTSTRASGTELRAALTGVIPCGGSDAVDGGEEDVFAVEAGIGEGVGEAEVWIFGVGEAACVRREGVRAGIQAAVAAAVDLLLGHDCAIAIRALGFGEGGRGRADGASPYRYAIFADRDLELVEKIARWGRHGYYACVER